VRNLKKVLSAMLAMVLVFGTMTIGAESAYADYKDSAILGYDSIDKPILSTAQYSSMLMDEVDRMLAQSNLQIKQDLAGLLEINLNLSSVDSALDGVVSLWNSVAQLKSIIGGDIQYLNFDAITGNSNLEIPIPPCPRRDTAGKTDGDILLALFQFIADNAGIISKIPQGTVEDGGLDLGILAGFVDISEFLDLELLAKEAVANFVYPDYEEDPEFALFDPKEPSLDEYISIFINSIADGSYSERNPDESDSINEISEMLLRYVPGFTSQVDLVNDSVYEIIEKCFRICLNSVVVPLANKQLKREIRKICGYVYTPVLDDEGEPVLDAEGDPTFTEDASEVNEYANLLNVDFHLDPFSFSGWGSIETDTFVNHANEILGIIVEEFANPATLTINWNYDDGNAGLLDNVITVAKQVLAVTGNEFFANYVEVIPPEQLAVMTDEEFTAYLIRSILNGSIDDVNIPNTCDTNLEVIFEAVKSLAANLVPSRNYSTLTADLDDILLILTDVAVYGLNQVTNMDLDYGISFDDLVNECFNWIQTNYGGFVSSISGADGWEKLSSLVFSVFSSSWLPTDDYGAPREDLYSILFDDILYNMIDLNVEGLLALLQRNDDPDADFNNTIIEVLLGRIVAIFNYIIPNTFTSQYTPNSLEDLLDPDILSSLLYQLLTGLNSRAAAIMPSLLPLLCSSMGLSSPQKFDYPYISIPETLNPATTTTFYMFNGSSGINTAFTNKNGITTRDQLYKYQITSVQTNQPGVTISPTTGTINGGEARTFTIGGTTPPADDSVLCITITYNVLEESGNVMTPTPLKATCYTFISDDKDDSDNKTKYDLTSNNTHLVYATAKYFNQNSSIMDLGGVTFTLQRNVATQATQHVANATFSLTSSVIDSTLAACGVCATPLDPIATTKAGGAWPYLAYTVDAEAERPEDGIYASRYVFNATPTNSTAETISLDHLLYFYNDFDLPSLFSSAVRSNRQQSNYDQGSYEVTYRDFYATEDTPEEEANITETVTGSDVWDNYISALSDAAAVIYRPRMISTFDSTHLAFYETYAYNLYTAIQQLEGGSLSSGASSVKTALESFVPPCATKLNEEEVEVDVDYYENGYTYFGREDYVGYTYSNFKEEMRSAENLIEKWENDEDIDAIEAAYVGHRLTLYGNRLIRVRAYTEHLQQAVVLANAVQAGHYDSETWEEFLNARTFANAVVAEPIGACVSGTEFLVGDGLRQSKVNRARSELIAATKRLVSSVDYAQLRDMRDIAKPVYEAGNDPEIYTVLSWDAFEAAYEYALEVLGEKYPWSEENQLIVDNAYTALNDAYEALETSALPDIKPVVTPGVEPLILEAHPDTYSSYDGLPVNFVYGLDIYNLFVDGLYESTGGAYVVIDRTFNNSGIDSTGVRITVYTDETMTTVVKSYWIVVFGDINGDGTIDYTDYSVIVDAYEYTYDWTWYSADDNPWMYSCDLNHDGGVDSTDLSIMLDANEYWYSLNQSWDGTLGGDYSVPL